MQITNIPKNHPISEALGTLDELNAFLGDAKAACNDGCETAEIIEGIQKDLYKLMGYLAGVKPSQAGVEQMKDENNRLCVLIEKLKSELPSLTGFVIPGKNPVSAKLHIARTVCRRAERRLLDIKFENEYLNQLSKLLFLLAQKNEEGIDF